LRDDKTAAQEALGPLLLAGEKDELYAAEGNEFIAYTNLQ
jgi:hypothetical protein